jgi:hypothetical protein
MMEFRGGPQSGGVSLVDVLDKVLDKGLVVAGDIRVSLASVELLTIKVRLVLCSIDKASEVGLDWWRNDAFFGNAAGSQELQQRVEALEQQLDGHSKPAPEKLPAPRRRSRLQT